ncbi:MAG: histidinol dehydrogenase, partial [Roseiarcus sp.]
MAVFLDADAPDFEARFVTLLNAKRESSVDVDDAVAAIIADVRARGDAALAEYSLRFDRADLARKRIRISAAEVDAAVAASDPSAVDALEFAYARILAYHRRQALSDVSFVDTIGVELGWRWR